MPATPFPHLLPAEALIWYRFLVQHGNEWDRFDYDVRVGGGRPVDAAHPDYIQAMAKRLSLKRIDAVGYRGSHPTIFEVSPRGGRVLYGALLMYRKLFVQAFPQLGQPDLVAVVGTIDPDLLAVAQSDGIRVYVLPE